MAYLKGTGLRSANGNKCKLISKDLNTLEILYALKLKFAQAPFFVFNGKKLPYFNHSYNNNRMTERSIEIPIVHYYLTKYKPKRCLEIGNVSNHYYEAFQNLMIPKIVVDKYEKGIGVINKDIKDYNSKAKFDFVFSISTFEHMDSDRGRNKDYIKRSPDKNTNICNNMIHVINDLLKPKGVFIITAPIGYTIEWNQTILNPKKMNKNFLNVESINIYHFERFGEILWRKWNLTKKEIVYWRKFVFTPHKFSSKLTVVEIIK